MTQTDLQRLLREHAITADLTSEEVLEIAQCGHNALFSPGDYLFREGRTADALILVRAGRVSLELHTPRGGAERVETLQGGDVIGFSWMFPPYEWQVDCRALEPTRALVLDAAPLREAMARSPRIGYAISMFLVHHLAQRLERLRLRALDVYGARR